MAGETLSPPAPLVKEKASLTYQPDANPGRMVINNSLHPPLVSVPLPDGTIVELLETYSEGTNQILFLQQLMANAGEIVPTSAVYGKHSRTAERNLEHLAYKLRRKIAPLDYAIDGIRGENGELGFIFRPQYIIMPNGEQARTKGEESRKVLQALVDKNINRETEGIDAKDTHAEITPSTEKQLDNAIFRVQPFIPEGYRIRKFKGPQRELRAVLEDLSLLGLILSNGERVTSLTPSEEAVLRVFSQINLPLYLDSIVEDGLSGEEFVKKKILIQEKIRSINTKLTDTVNISRVSKNRGSLNPAYRMLQPDGTSFPNGFEDLSGEQLPPETEILISQRVNTIQNLLQLQGAPDRPILVDEENERLEDELLSLEERLAENADKKKREENLAALEMEGTAYFSLIPKVATLYFSEAMDEKNHVLYKAGVAALREALVDFKPDWGIFFQDYAEFHIRGTIGNALFHDAPEASPRERSRVMFSEIENRDVLREKLMVALIDLSKTTGSRQGPITPDESRAVDILTGITSKKSGKIGEVSQELGVSNRRAWSIYDSAMRKISNSPHAAVLSRYLRS